MEGPLSHKSRNPLLFAVASIILIMLTAAYFSPEVRRFIPFFPDTGFGDVATDILGQIDAADTPYFTSDSINNNVNARGFDTPDDMLIDPVNHRLFVTDTVNNRVLVFNLDGANELTDRVADFVLGGPDFKTTYAAGPSSSSFSAPKSIAFDEGASRLFIADEGYSRVLVFDVSTIVNGEGAVAVLGEEDFEAQSGAITADDAVGLPAGLVFDDEHDRLFVSDFEASRVLVFDALTIDNGDPAVAVLNESDFGTGDGSLTSLGKMTYDTIHEILYVTNSSGITLFDVNQIANGESPVGAVTTLEVPCESGCIDPEYAYDLAYDAPRERLFTSDPSNVVRTFDVFYQGILLCATSTGCDETAEWPVGLNSFQDIRAMIKEPSGVIYAGAGSDVIDMIIRCDTSTGCDDQGEWTVAAETDTPVTSFVYDAGNGVIYAGGGELFHRCVVSSGCDAQGDWVSYTNTGYFLESFGTDSTNQILYAVALQLGLPTLDGTADILRCDVLTLCDEASDWVAVKSEDYRSSGHHGSIVFDSSSGIIYADYGGFSWCDTTSSCDASVDWSDAAGFGNSINAIEIINGVLYTGNDVNEIYRCDPVTACDDVADFTLAYDGGDAEVLTITEDTDSDIIYAGTGLPGGSIIRCDLSSGCDGQADWSVISSPNSLRSVYSLLYDAPNDTLYAGTLATQFVRANTLGLTNGSCAFDNSQCILSTPRGVFYELSTDTLFVADTDSNRVMEFDTAVVTNSENAVDMLGHLDENDDPAYPGFIGFAVFGPANNVPNAQGFSAPGSVAIDATNHFLYVADTFNNRVLVYELDVSNNIANRTADFVLGQPTIKDVAVGGGQSGMNNPDAVAVDEAGQRLFVADTLNARVLVFDTSAHSNGQNAVNVIGQNDFVGITGETTRDGLIDATSLAFDISTQRLFVGDNSNGRVMVFDVDPAVLIANNSGTDGPDAINVIGKDDFTGGGAVNGQDGIGSVFGVAFDSGTQRLFVSDSFNNRILVFNVNPAVLIDSNASTDGPNAINVIGQDTFAGVGVATTRNGLSFPLGVTFDTYGKRLFVADATNNRVLVFDADNTVLIPNTAITNGPDATEAFGQPDFTSSGTGTTSSTLSFPWYVTYAVDTERLYVTDVTNNRVAVYGSPPIFTPTPTPVDPVSPTPPEPPGGGPRLEAFVPKSIIVEDIPGDPDGAEFADDQWVDVTVRAVVTNNFAQSDVPVNVVLSNEPTFQQNHIYVYHEFSHVLNGALRFSNGTLEWKRDFSFPPHTWDLCFGITNCPTPRNYRVYARFYVNIPAPEPGGAVTDPGQTQGCKVRPACLDATPVCTVAFPPAGWCIASSGTLHDIIHLFRTASANIGQALNLLQ